MAGQITITNDANRLYHTFARQIGGGEQAIHIAWALNKNREGGYWMLGFSPESHFLGADQKILDYIVAGRCREILVVVDGPMPKAAKDMKIYIDIDIDSPDGRAFKVTVSE
jgi:hypothetical protein